MRKDTSQTGIHLAKNNNMQAALLLISSEYGYYLERAEQLIMIEATSLSVMSLAHLEKTLLPKYIHRERRR